MTIDAGRALVRTLLAQIEERGTDALDAALALADLLERERISRDPSVWHGPDLTDTIRRMFGAPTADTRLSPRAIEDAIVGLMAHVERGGLPAVAVIRAMARSFDPRVAPALVALLERIIDDPHQADLAEQVVNALVNFLDDVALRGLRIAASRGRGRAKEIADHGLRGSPDPADPAAVPVRTARAVIAIDGAITRLQRRPGHHEVIIDAGDGLRLIDPDRPEAIRRIVLAREFPRTSGIAAWCLRADGDAAVVFADDGTLASRVSLRDGTATAIALPPPHAGDSFELPRYVWTDPDRLIARWSLANTPRELRGDATAFTTPASVFIRRDFRAWVGALDTLSPRTSYVMRTEPAGTFLRGLDTLPATAASPPVLVVAAAPLTAPTASQLLVFAIGEPS